MQQFKKLQTISSSRSAIGMLGNYIGGSKYKGKITFQTKLSETVQNGIKHFHIFINFQCCPKNSDCSPFLHYISSDNIIFQLNQYNNKHKHQEIPSTQRQKETERIKVKTQKLIMNTKQALRKQLQRSQLQKQKQIQLKENIQKQKIWLKQLKQIQEQKIKQLQKLRQKKRQEQQKKSKQRKQQIQKQKYQLRQQKLKQKKEKQLQKIQQMKQKIQLKYQQKNQQNNQNKILQNKKTKIIKKQTIPEFKFYFPLQIQAKELKSQSFSNIQQVIKQLKKLSENQNHRKKNIQFSFMKRNYGGNNTLYVYFRCCHKSFSQGPVLHFTDTNHNKIRLSDGYRLQHYHKITDNTIPIRIKRGRPLIYLKKYKISCQQEQSNNIQIDKQQIQQLQKPKLIIKPQIQYIQQPSNDIKISPFKFPSQQQLIKLTVFHEINQIKQKFLKLAHQYHHLNKNIRFNFYHKINNQEKLFNIYYKCCKGLGQNCPKVSYKKQGNAPYKLLRSYRLTHYHTSDVKNRMDFFIKLKTQKKINQQREANQKQNKRSFDRLNKQSLNKQSQSQSQMRNQLPISKIKIIKKIFPASSRFSPRFRDYKQICKNTLDTNKETIINNSYQILFINKQMIMSQSINQISQKSLQNLNISAQDNDKQIVSNYKNTPELGSASQQNELTIKESIKFYRLFKIDQQLRRNFLNHTNINFEHINAKIQNEFQNSYFCFKKQKYNNQQKINYNCLQKLITQNQFIYFSINQETSSNQIQNNWVNKLFIKQLFTQKIENQSSCIYLSTFPLTINNNQSQLILTIAYTLSFEFKQQIIWFSLTQVVQKKYKSFLECLQGSDDHDYLYNAIKKSLQFTNKSNIKFIFTTLNCELLNSLQHLKTESLNKKILINFSIHIQAFKSLLDSNNQYSHVQIFKNISQKIRNHPNKDNIGKSYKYLKDHIIIGNMKDQSSLHVDLVEILKHFNIFNQIFQNTNHHKVNKHQQNKLSEQFLELSFLSFDLIKQITIANLKDPIQSISSVFKYIQNIQKSQQVVLVVLSYFNNKKQTSNINHQHNSSIIPNNIIWASKQMTFFNQQNNSDINKMQESKLYELLSNENHGFQLIVQNCPDLVKQLIYHLIKSTFYLQSSPKRFNNDENKQQFMMVQDQNKQQKFNVFTPKTPTINKQRKLKNNAPKQKIYKDKTWRCECNFYEFTGIPCQHQIYCALQNQNSLFNQISQRWKSNKSVQQDKVQLTILIPQNHSTKPQTKLNQK